MVMRTMPPGAEWIFVFGSNTRGRHGRGAALDAAAHYGAVRGIGEGRQGQSYAITTKGASMRRLRLADIRESVDRFLEYARAHPALRFFVTAIGTGLAGYRHEQIAPMFIDAPSNCDLPPEWLALRVS